MGGLTLIFALLALGPRSGVAARGSADAGQPAGVAAELTLRYLGNSGFLLDTGKQVLLFDYVGFDPNSGAMGGALRLVKPDDLGARRVTVFVSHEHPDHYAPEILGWRDKLPGMTYLLGGIAGSGPGIHRLGPRDHVSLGDLDVWTIKSTDIGVGFLVRVDDLEVFHAGDHGLWSPDDAAAYRAELDYIAELKHAVDLAYLPIATGLDCEPRESLREGAFLAVEMLKPTITVPMHVRCPDRQNLYSDFVNRARDRGLKGVMAPPELGGTLRLPRPSKRLSTAHFGHRDH